MKEPAYTRKANILKALAHPLRLQIIDILAKESITVTELSKRMDEVQANVSRHLSILKREEIVDFDKKGVATFYKIKYDCIMNTFICLDEIIKESLKGEIEMLKKL